jgi:CRISPR-associated endonuclease/helicase Cas3
LGDLGTPDVLLPTHSISDRVFDSEMDGSTSDFFIDTWQSSFIVTTFDQFLLALFGPRARHLMRYHNLYDALIILDEVQTLPCKLWDSVNNIFKTLTNVGNTRFLVMSATQPGFLTDAHELVPDPEKEFAHFKRYQIVLKHHSKQNLEDFTNSLVKRLSEFEDQRVLITLNTRRSARFIRDAFDKAGASHLYFISADVTPKDRLCSILKIKEGAPCIVVSTQCVEAGVDIDMDLVIRDFGPFDAIVQIAGRCNRNNKKPRCNVEIVSLKNENGQIFSEMIYDKFSLQETYKVLGEKESIGEEDIFRLCSDYFRELGKRDTGKDITENFAYWREIPSIRELLRGQQREKYEFIVAKEEPGLVEAIKKALDIDDRWEKRREIRRLAGQIGRVTVSVYAKKDWMPEEFADACGPFWILKDKYYQSDRGLVLPDSETEQSGAKIL